MNLDEEEEPEGAPTHPGNARGWELESRKEAAETMAAALAYQDWGQVMASRLVGFVDFRDVESHSEVEKRDRLP